LTGSINADTVSLRQTSPIRIERTDKRKGHVVMVITMSLLLDGKVLIVTQKGITAAGDMVDNTMAYDRQ
jgi:hypothetical protein